MKHNEMVKSLLIRAPMSEPGAQIPDMNLLQRNLMAELGLTVRESSRLTEVGAAARARLIAQLKQQFVP